MNKQSILVVEDHVPLLKAVQDILQTDGYIVLTATDGREAIRLMEDSCPDLIVTDILMPRMDGYAFRKAICARSEWEQIPFIFLTAKAEIEDILKAKGIGADSYLVKPFDPDELLTTIHSVLEHSVAAWEASKTEA
jgi:DNA-binding response OmpR family regulator